MTNILEMSDLTASISKTYCIPTPKGYTEVDVEKHEPEISTRTFESIDEIIEMLTSRPIVTLGMRVFDDRIEYAICFPHFFHEYSVRFTSNDTFKTVTEKLKSLLKITDKAYQDWYWLHE